MSQNLIPRSKKAALLVCVILLVVGGLIGWGANATVKQPTNSHGATTTVARSGSPDHDELVKIQNELNGYLASTSTTVPGTTSTVLKPTSPTSSTTTTVPGTTTTVPVAAYPNQTNTGVAADVVLTPAASCSISTPGTYDAKLFNCGEVFIDVAGVTITHSKIAANTFSVVGVRADSFTMTDTDIDCQSTPGAYGINVLNTGTSATFARLNIHDCENGIEPGSGTTFRDSYVHRLRSSPDGHNDGVSIDGGQVNVLVQHNTIDVTDSVPGAVSAVMTDNCFGPLTGIKIDSNRLLGGGFTVYADGRFGRSCTSGSLPTNGVINVTFTSNVITSGNYGYALVAGTTNVQQSPANVDPSGKPVTL